MADVQVSDLPLISQITEDDMLLVNDGNVTTSIISWADALGSISRLRGQVLFDNGVETLPSIAFYNDISTGLYNPNNNELAFVTNATQRAVFDEAGRFGVANYTPGVYNEGANNVVIGDTDLGDNGLTIVSGTTHAGIINFADGTGTQAAEGQIVYDHLDNHLGFSVGAVESLRINFEGDVTIGTAVNQAGSKLTVDGGAVTLQQGSSAVPAYNFIGDGDTGFYSPGPNQVAVVTGGISQMYIDAEGQIGIGVQDAQASIHIQRPNPVIRIEDSDAIGSPYAEASTVNGDIVISADPGQLADNSKVQLVVDGVEQLRADNSGKLIVRNDVYFNDPANEATGAYGIISHDPTTGSLIVGADPDDLYEGSDIRIMVNGQNQIEIKSNGDINMASDGNLTFDEDPDTYFYHPAQDQLAVSTAGQERLRFGALGHIMVGSETPRFIAQNSPGLQVSGNDPSASAAFMIYSPDTQGTGIHIGKSRSSTIGGVASVQPGDNLGYVAWSGADGSSMNAVGASVAVVVDNAVGTDSVPSSFIINTTSVGETSPTQRLQIESSGTVRLLNTPETTGTAFGVGATGTETFKVTTGGDVSAEGDVSITGKVTATDYDIESLPLLP